jgi:hypothetical protein
MVLVKGDEELEIIIESLKVQLPKFTLTQYKPGLVTLKVELVLPSCHT